MMKMLKTASLGSNFIGFCKKECIFEILSKQSTVLASADAPHK